MDTSIIGPGSGIYQRVKSAIESPREAINLLEESRESLRAVHGGKKLELDLQPPDDNIVIVGDLHGDYQSLRRAFSIARREGFPRRSTIVFLGDYIDRGPEQLRVFYTVLALQMEYPDNVLLLRGNHEPPKGIPVIPHDYPEVLRVHYPTNYREIYEASQRIWDSLFLAVFWPSLGLLALHGGLPTHTYKKASTLAEYLGGVDSEWNTIYTEIIWNDPTEAVPVRMPSMRGIGYEFGSRITRWVADNFGVSLVARGHQAVRTGYKLDHRNIILTIFTRLGPPYFNEKACLYILKTGSRASFREEGLRCFGGEEDTPHIVM